MLADKCDFKYHRITEGNKNMTVDYSIYEGAITTEDEPDINRDMQPVTRYRRSGGIDKQTVVFNRPFSINALHAHMKNLLKNVPNRTPIDEQL